MHAGEGRAMRPPPAPCPNDRQGQPRNAFAQALGRGAGGRPRRGPSVPPRQRRPGGDHALADDTRQPRHDPPPPPTGVGSSRWQGHPAAGTAGARPRGAPSAGPEHSPPGMGCGRPAPPAPATAARPGRWWHRPASPAARWRWPRPGARRRRLPPGLVPPAPSRVGCHRAAAGAPARVRCTAPPAARAPGHGSASPPPPPAARARHGTAASHARGR